MVIGSLLAFALSSLGVGPVGQLLLVAAMCLVVGLARLEAPPRLRLALSEQDRDEHEADRERSMRTA